MVRKESTLLVLEGVLNKTPFRWTLNEPFEMSSDQSAILLGKPGGTIDLESELRIFLDHNVRITIEDI